MRVSWVLFQSSTSLTHAYGRLNLQHWFPKYEHFFSEAATQCEYKLQAYLENDRTVCKYPCSCAADCILQNVTGTMQSNLQSAQVLLGLLPTILPFGGPKIAEMAALSTYRPALAILLSFASPTTSVSRLFSMIDLEEPFVPPTSLSLPTWSTSVAGRTEASVIQYKH